MPTPATRRLGEAGCTSNRNPIRAIALMEFLCGKNCNRWNDGSVETKMNCYLLRILMSGPCETTLR